MLHKLNKFLTGLFYLMKNPRLMNAVLDKTSYWQDYVRKKYGFENGMPHIELGQISPNYSQKLDKIAFLEGGSMLTDLALLRTLAAQFENCRYFEIGTWRGESAINVVDLTSECYTLNLSENEMKKIGLSEDYIQMQAFFSKGNPDIHHLYGDSRSFDFGELGKMDLIFIDGDHQYKMVKNDTKKVFEHLVHENSVVVWHDYAFDPETIRFEVLAGVLDGLPHEGCFKQLYGVFNTKCLIYSPKEFHSTKTLKKPIKPNSIFKVELKQREIE